MKLCKIAFCAALLAASTSPATADHSPLAGTGVAAVRAPVPEPAAQAAASYRAQAARARAAALEHLLKKRTFHSGNPGRDHTVDGYHDRRIAQLTALAEQLEARAASASRTCN
ncbi:MAG TPA: hypothetical protein VEC57_11085 [Candidatus Limnocylindrales bacterium]|nr:hypothetical protein [Candidatus Limnocylindrales bacterium]